MRKILAIVMVLLLLITHASVFAEGSASSDDRSAYSVRPVCIERIQEDNTLILELYGINIIQGDPKSITPGWQFSQLGKDLTVKKVIEHSADEYEIIAEEDTFQTIVFRRLVPGMNIWGIWLDDCQSVSLSEILEIALPLDESFVFIWEAPDEADNVPYTVDEFLSFLQGDEGKQFNQYNSEVTLLDGKLIEFRHRDYPAGLDLD